LTFIGFKFLENVRGRSSHNYVCIRITKFFKIPKKDAKKYKNWKCLCYDFSYGISKIRFSFENYDHGVVNNLDMVLFGKSEARGGVEERFDLKNYRFND
jgi:hypothetical protein